MRTYCLIQKYVKNKELEANLKQNALAGVLSIFNMIKRLRMKEKPNEYINCDFLSNSIFINDEQSLRKNSRATYWKCSYEER